MLRVQSMALHPAAEPVSVRRQCLVRVESPDVHSALNLRDVAVSRRERPVRPEARSENAAVLQAQSKGHRPAVSRSMVREVWEVWHPALALRPEAEPSVQAVAQSEQALPSEQQQVAAQPSEVREVEAEQPLARLVAEAVQPSAQQAAVAEQDAQPAAEVALDVLQVEEAVQAARRVAATQALPWEARAELLSAEPSVRSDPLVLRLARRRTTMLPVMTLRHAPEAVKVERPRSQSSSAESVGCFSW